MTNPPKEWEVEYSEQAKGELADDPKAAQFVRELTSRMKQVMQEFEAGRFKSIDEALRSIGMEPVDPDDVPDEIMEQAMEKDLAKKSEKS